MSEYSTEYIEFCCCRAWQTVLTRIIRSGKSEVLQMKEVLGIFAAIAAVAGIASAVSKNDEKEEAAKRQREQELELEERRLTVEEAQRKHIQQMEQQRMQMEREKRDYQMKLANAPKKPVYKTVAALQCPLCMGHREVNEAAGEVHCPYCGAAEQLEVDHYEIDQAAFQKQLQEAEEQRAAQEALELRNERLNTAIKFVAVIMGVALLILWISPIVGLVFFVPPFLLFCFLLYKRYPEKGGKVWNAVRFPLTCIFVFPLPLTVLFMGSEKMEERFSRKARIGMSIGVWAVYAALICVLGGLYVKGFRNAVHSDPPPTNVTTEAPATEKTTKATTAKTTAKTTTTTQAKVEIPSKDKKQLEYFNSETNAKIQIGSAEVEIPENWIEQEDFRSDVFHAFFDKPDSIEFGRIDVWQEPLDKYCTVNDFKNNKKKLAEKITNHVISFKSEDSLLNGIMIDKRDGIYGAAIGDLKDTEEKNTIEYHISLLFDESAQQVIAICLYELHDADSTYFNDYSKIVQSVRFTSDEAETSASVETEPREEESSEAELSLQDIKDMIANGDYSLVTPEFKQTMDAYEAFYDDYLAFMNRYNSGEGDVMAMLNDYMTMMSDMEEWTKKIDAIDESKLSPADDAYYLLVTLRIEKKLMNAM